MQFITVRDFREKSAKIWDSLQREQELVITSNGKPIAILSSASEGDLEETLAAIRQARAQLALTMIQQSSLDRGKDKLSDSEIEREIKTARKARTRK